MTLIHEPGTALQPRYQPTFAMMQQQQEPPPLAVLIAGWIASLESDRSRETYQASLISFTQYMGTGTLEEAISALMLNAAHANLVVQSFREWLRSQLYIKGNKPPRPYSPASVNLKLAALRSLCHYLDAYGPGPGLNLKVKGCKSRTLRDCRGPEHSEIAAMIDTLQTRTDTPKGRRDYAMFLLLALNGLRRQEVVGIQLEDFHGSWIAITGKGHRESEPVSIPPVTRAAIEAWLVMRGNEPGSLFQITGSGLLKVISRLSLDALGRPATVHSLRHSACTDAARGHDLMAVQKFARHSNPATTQRYIDSAADYSGTVSGDLARSHGL